MLGRLTCAAILMEALACTLAAFADYDVGQAAWDAGRPRRWRNGDRRRTLATIA